MVRVWLTRCFRCSILRSCGGRDSIFAKREERDGEKDGGGKEGEEKWEQRERGMREGIEEEIGFKLL